MTHEEKACEIVNNFKGATVDHFGCCLMQEQIVKALTAAKEEGFREGVEHEHKKHCFGDECGRCNKGEARI